MKNIDLWKSNPIYQTINAEQFPHSSILISQDNFALEYNLQNILMSLMCKREDKPCFNCKDCQKVLHNNCVDIHVYPQKNKVLQSAEIGELIDNAYKMPYEADCKIVVIKNANQIDISMQNKLLKTLEEPPANTFFILLANEITNILPTIKSRCRKFYLPTLSMQQITEELQQLNISKELQTLVVDFGEGNLDLTLNYAKDLNFEQNVDFLHKLLLNFNKSWQMLDYAENLYKKSEEWGNILKIFLKILQNVITVKVKEDKNFLPVYYQIANIYSLDALIELVKMCTTIQEKMARNCNYNTVIDYFLFTILEVLHKWPI